ncbi:glycosyltransferase [Verrucomicrobiaceae bacterium E54]|nr:glycosyltransferase [Verrucomicrobiaceae bacterium E54]
MISVLLPFRNAAETIVGAIDSLLAQRGVDFEVLAVDDGSSDGSTERVRGFQDRRLRLEQNRGPGGIVGALETGRKLVKSAWIARMDADDLAHPDRLARQLERAMQPDRPEGVACRVRLLNPWGEGMKRYVEWVNSLSDADEISRARFIESPLIHPSMLIRAESLDRAGGWREVPWAEDHDLWLRMLAQGCRFTRVPEVLLDWRDGPERLTRNDARYGDEARMAMRCHHLARLPGLAARGVSIAGAGPIGKRLARGLIDEGVALHGFFEVNPRRIGETIHGVPVVGSEEIATHWRDSVLLGAVGIPGGREQVGRVAASAGREEGVDFWSVC